MIAFLCAFALADSVDRSHPPDIYAPEVLDLPGVETHALTDGIRVDLVRVPGVRKVEVHAILREGSLQSPGWPNATTAALGGLWGTSSVDHDADALAELIDTNDVSLSSWIGVNNAGVDLSIPKEDLALGVDLLGEVLRTPALPKADIKRYQRNVMHWYLVEALTDSHTVGNAAMSYAWYTPDSPYGARPDIAGISDVSHKTLAEVHAGLIDAPLVILVVGDVGWADIEPMLTATFAGMGRPGDVADDPPVPLNTGSRVIAVDMPGEEQASLQLRLHSPLRGDADESVAQVLDFTLGGAFLSRINSNLREEKGWTYGAYSYLFTAPTRANWTVSVDVPSENVGDAIGEIDAEIAQVASEGITAEEIEAARNTAVAGWNETLSTASSAAGFYEDLLYKKKSVADARAELIAVDAITVEDTKRVAAKWWGADAPRLWVIVGDRKAIEPQLQARGLAVTWITPEQAIRGTL